LTRSATVSFILLLPQSICSFQGNDPTLGLYSRRLQAHAGSQAVWQLYEITETRATWDNLWYATACYKRPTHDMTRLRHMVWNDEIRVPQKIQQGRNKRNEFGRQTTCP
jgi:hypothetical protein